MDVDRPTNDLLYAIAKRARELVDETLPQLRVSAGFGCDTDAEAIAMNRHRKRGDLIEEILVEEFEIAADDIDGRLT